MDVPLQSALEGVESSRSRASSSSSFESKIEAPLPRIVVAGIGGAGNNTVNRIASSGISGVETVAVNTDKAHLTRVKSDKKILIGQEITKGRGTGGHPKLGLKAAEAASEKFGEIFQNSDLVFLAYGLGGGTGTGAGPVAARIAKEGGAVVTGVVTVPFDVENRAEVAQEGLRELRRYADSVVVIDNNRLSDMTADLPIRLAFTVADEVLTNMLKGITETIVYPSLVNLDFADVKSIMEEERIMFVGIGEASGEGRAQRALEQALTSPLLGDIDYSTSSNVIMHIAGMDVTLSEVDWMARRVKEKTAPDAQVLWSARVDLELGETLCVILLVSGANSPRLLGSTPRSGVEDDGGASFDRSEAPLDLQLPSI